MTYTFHVTATNFIGESERSSPSLPVLPSGPSTVALSGGPAVTGQQGTVSATITTTHGFPVDGGELTLLEGDRELGRQPVSEGAADVPVVLGAGPHVLTGVYSGKDGVAASTATLALEVSKATQAIDFAELPALTYGDAPVELAATASSGLPVAYAAAGACTVEEATLTLTGAGACTVTASQAGDAETQAAEDVTRTAEVAKKPQSIEFPSLPELVYGDAPVTLAATSTSGLAVSYAAEGACSVSGSRLTLTAPGTCTVTATQAGDDLTAEAAPVTQSAPVAKTPQEILVEEVPPVAFGEAPQVLRAMATSGLPVSWTAHGACSVDGVDDTDALRARMAVEELAAPTLIDYEVVSAARGLTLAGHLSPGRAADMLTDFDDLPLQRWPFGAALRRRAFELRGVATAYDAAYVALAEALECPLLTRDQRLARAWGHEAVVQVL